jgi:citrate synthase
MQMLISTEFSFTSRGESISRDKITFKLINSLNSGFEAEFVPIMMLAQRLAGIMAHWRESMSRVPFSKHHETLADIPHSPS